MLFLVCQPIKHFKNKHVIGSTTLQSLCIWLLLENRKKMYLKSLKVLNQGGSISSLKELKHTKKPTSILEQINIYFGL